MDSLNLSWSDDYKIGIAVIDEQHKRLFAYFDELATVIASGNPQGIEVIVNGLVSYAISHNTFEESLMAKARYPMLDAHHKVHESFKSRANKYLRQLEAGCDPLKLAEQVRIFIGLWLINHVKQEDRDYVPYVQKIDSGSLLSGLWKKLFR
ncbi:bacteriohemerythrin [Pseudomonas sp. A-1]|uniref:bacteriohemerythrin n=1 Tax=Pseudomonas sp. A-1 TaxID=1821274 RepID=UPI0010A674B3|nr:bacteriohemerythrin [Pseudomonas sp. A-1]THG77601.1 bacteriohemerythrin [Pseudomonas sp. A-1]